MSNLPESRIRANQKYADKALKKMTFAFNRYTDSDVLEYLKQCSNKRKLIITAIREYKEKNQPR